MSLKSKVIICCCILAICLGVYEFSGGDTLPTSKHKPSTIKKQRQTMSQERQANDEDMVTAILIMPKSYLPALKRFSQSAMARDIKILQADLEVKDGQMMAVRQLKRSQRPKSKIENAAEPARKLPESSSKDHPALEKQAVSTGLLYLLAGMQNHRFMR